MPSHPPAEVTFIDCDALIHWPTLAKAECRSDVPDLCAEMKRLNITAAIVRHGACIEAAPYFGNDLLMRAIGRRPGLIPAWCLTPEGREPDFNPAALVRRMLKAGVRVAWMDCEAGGYLLRPWCAGRLLGILEERKIPLLLNYRKLVMDHLADVLRTFPGLRVILHNIARIGRNRHLWPLLEKYPALHLCFGPTFSAHEGFPALCRDFGSRRWVWGAGYPACEGGAAVTGLMYAGLQRDVVEAIAHNNMERLLKEVE
jgi:hypothetical protein